MWFIGLIVGLLLGAAFESFETAMLLGALGTVIGAIIGRRGGDDGELQRQVRQLQEQLKQANVRITHIEKYLEQATAERGSEGLWQEGKQAPAMSSVAVAASMPATATDPTPETAAAAPQPAVPLPELATAAVDEAELTRQALAADAPAEASADALPPLLAVAASAAADTCSERTLAPLEMASIAEDPSVAARNAAASGATPTDADAPAARATTAAAADAAAPAAAPTGKGPAKASSATTAGRRRPAAAQIPTTPPWLQTFIARWITGGNPIVKVGVLVLFLGLAFLLRYVAANTVVPIELRYAGVGAAGIGMLLAGWRWRHKQDRYGLILQGGGIGVLYLTTLAGMKLHPLIPPEFGFAILIAVAICAALLAILQDALALAVVATLGGFAAPVLASTGSEHHLAFFTYLAIINLGILAIAWFKAWRILNLIGFMATLALAGGWAERYYEPSLFATAEPFLLLFFVVYVLIAFLFARRTLASVELASADNFAAHVRDAAPRIAYVDASLVFGVPIFIFGLQYLLTRSFEYGAAFSALGFGLTYVVLGYLLFRRSGLRYALLSETMLALAIVFGSLAIPFGLDSEWTSAAWAVEAAGVYWVGIRQQRLHARFFALLLIVGAAVSFALGLGAGDGDAFLAGSPLGSLLLALSLAWTCRQQIRHDAELHELEQALHPALLAAACLFAALLPLLLWPLAWAAPALALLATAGLFAGLRLRNPALAAWSGAYQLLAGFLYLFDLHAGDAGIALAGGWQGLCGAILIAVPLLAAAIVTRGRGKGELVPPYLSALTLVTGFAFLALAPLFVASWLLSATVWPLLSLAILVWALRRGDMLAIAVASVLQLCTALVCVDGSRFLFPTLADDTPLAAFGHAGFWAPMLLSLAALVSARRLQRTGEGQGLQALAWGALGWSLLWWAHAWQHELVRLCSPSDAIAALIVLAALTACACRLLASRLAWQAIGQTTIVYLPTLLLLAVAQYDWAQVRPLAGWGMLAWALALFAHLRLLAAQPSWFPLPLRQGTHAAGVWLFVALLAHEVHEHFLVWPPADSAWPLVSWIFVPLAFLAAVNSRRLARRWPAPPLGDAYTRLAVWPLAALLLAWVCYGATLGNGSAPLRYLPLINPLELGQIAVLVSIAHWWLPRRHELPFARLNGAFAAVLGATAFLALSAAVLRACHQLTGLSWRAEVLYTSLLAQSALSIVWSVVAIALMLIGNRQRRRPVWIAGAILIAVVVAKLFLIELAARDSLERIVSFIVVGVLLLLVGYFAPLPPRRADAAEQPVPAADPSSQESPPA